jgi:hypothetical protein
MYALAVKVFILSILFFLSLNSRVICRLRIAFKVRIGLLIDIYSIYTYSICVADKKGHTLMNWQLASRSQVSSPSFSPISTISTGLTVYPFKKDTEVSPAGEDRGCSTSL